MASLEQLLDALMRWSMRICQLEFPIPWDCESFMIVFAEVLCRIDHDYFQPLANGAPPTPTAIAALVSNFYREEMGLTVVPHLQSKEAKQMTQEGLVGLFHLIFGLAMQVTKQQFLMKVLELDVRDQQVLMDFVNDLVVQQPSSNGMDEQLRLNIGYIDHEPKELSMGGKTARQYRLLDELQLKDSQCRLYKQRLQELEQRQKQFQYHYQCLREENTRLLEELSNSKNQKLELIIELGLRSNQMGYGDITARYRQIMTNCQSKIDNLEHQLESRLNQLEQKNAQLQVLKNTIYGSSNTLPSDNNITNEEYERMEIVFQSRIDQLNHKIFDLTETLQEKNGFILSIMKEKEQLQIDNNELKMSITKNEQSLERYRQLKRLTKGFFRQVESQFRV